MVHLANICLFYLLNLIFRTSCALLCASLPCSRSGFPNAWAGPLAKYWLRCFISFTSNPASVSRFCKGKSLRKKEETLPREKEETLPRNLLWTLLLKKGDSVFSHPSTQEQALTQHVGIETPNAFFVAQLVTILWGSCDHKIRRNSQVCSILRISTSENLKHL